LCNYAGLNFWSDNFVADRLKFSFSNFTAILPSVLFFRKNLKLGKFEWERMWWLSNL
jgi:hypothetical protein